MATSDAVLKRLEQKGAEADQIIDYLKQQVALLKEKASKKIWKFKFSREILKMNSYSDSKKNMFTRYNITSQSWWWLLYSFNIAIVSEQIFWD